MTLTQNIAIAKRKHAKVKAKRDEAKLKEYRKYVMRRQIRDELLRDVGKGNPLKAA